MPCLYFLAILLLFTELLLIKNMMEKGAELSGYRTFP